VLKGSAGTPETLYVANEEVLTLAQVRNVRYSVNADGRGALVFLLTDDGRNKLAAASRAHVGQRLAMFVKGELHSAPVVKEPLANGEFELWGAVYSDDQLRDLGHTLRTGLGYSP
jgi:preprotein translocase subunit SecD